MGKRTSSLAGGWYWKIQLLHFWETGDSPEPEWRISNVLRRRRRPLKPIPRSAQGPFRVTSTEKTVQFISALLHVQNRTKQNLQISVPTPCLIKSPLSQPSVNRQWHSFNPRIHNCSSSHCILHLPFFLHTINCLICKVFWSHTLSSSSVQSPTLPSPSLS